MPIFLSEFEREFIRRHRSNGVTSRLYWSTYHRVMRRAESPGLVSRDDTVEWWHAVEESLSDAALIHALEPSPVLGAWIRNTMMGIVRRPESDWVGPWFRDHSRNPPAASLETAHVTCAVSAALDLAGDVLTNAEHEEACDSLRKRAIPMAMEYLVTQGEVHNYWAVVNAGLAAAGAVLNDRPAMEYAAKTFNFYCDAFQPDGTYAESLQYANYACQRLMHAYESIARRDPKLAAQMNPDRYAGFAKWAAYAFLYNKPLSGWGQEPIARSINFGDSAAVFIPSAELLLHISARCSKTCATDAKLARWLFDSAINVLSPTGPHDRATFGFVNRPGFLSMPLLAHAGEGASPASLDLAVRHTFECGDVIARDAWEGRTTLAMRTGGEPMHVVSHVHGDANSIILVHNHERLLVDPGHSCYRNLIHDLECSSATHNTCTFQAEGESSERLQHGIANRKCSNGKMAAPIPALSKLILSDAIGPVQVFAGDAAGRYGEPIQRFLRFAILCGPHVIFIVDRICSTLPVKTRWNWLLNNRDRRGELKVDRPHQFEFRRGDAGLRMFNASAIIGGPQYAYVHDAYHPLPNQLGEGALGSGILMHWRETEARKSRTVVHAIAVDDSGRIAGWTADTQGQRTVLKGQDGEAHWSLDVSETSREFMVKDRRAQQTWSIHEDAAGAWKLTR